MVSPSESTLSPVAIDEMLGGPGETQPSPHVELARMISSAFAKSTYKYEMRPATVGEPILLQNQTLGRAVIGQGSVVSPAPGYCGPLITVRGNNLDISGLSLDGNGTSSVGIEFKSCRGVRLSHCHFRGFTDFAVSVKNCAFVTLDNCKFVDCRGVSFSNSVITRMLMCHLLRCSVGVQSDGSGLNIDSCYFAYNFRESPPGVSVKTIGTASSITIENCTEHCEPDTPDKGVHPSFDISRGSTIKVFNQIHSHRFLVAVIRGGTYKDTHSQWERHPDVPGRFIRTEPYSTAHVSKGVLSTGRTARLLALGGRR